MYTPRLKKEDKPVVLSWYESSHFENELRTFLSNIVASLSPREEQMELRWAAEDAQLFTAEEFMRKMRSDEKKRALPLPSSSSSQKSNVSEITNDAKNKNAQSANRRTRNKRDPVDDHHHVSSATPVVVGDAQETDGITRPPKRGDWKRFDWKSTTVVEEKKEQPKRYYCCCSLFLSIPHSTVALFFFLETCQNSLSSMRR
jgi:hypothetical protein